MKAKLITAREAAQLKGVSRAAIYAAVQDGRLPAHLELGRIALKEADVLAWTPIKQSGKRRSVPMSAETKDRISAAQRKRWASRKQQE